MRLALRLVVMITLIWCGLHIAEPADAHPVSALQQADIAAPADHMPDRDEAPQQSAHASHHCPVAADPQAATGAAPSPASPLRLFVPAAIPLPTLSRAPPLQPPSA